MAKAIPTAEAFRLFLKEHQLTGAQAGELVGLQARQIGIGLCSLRWNVWQQMRNIKHA